MKGEIPVYLPVGLDVNEESVRATVADCFDEITFNEKIKQYNAAKWVGAEQALDSWLMCNVPFGIGEEVFERLSIFMNARKRTRCGPLINVR